MTLQKNKFRTLLSLMTVMLILSSCASSQHESNMGPHSIYDPLEESNRKVFAFNQAIDGAFINPVVRGYQTVLPEPARKGVGNALRNLRTPTIFANQVLQGDFDGAGTALLRGVINTIAGIGGIFDVAKYMGLEHEHEDFGQTLAKWGVGHGPYMVVPVIGPSSARDYVGFFVDSYADPLRWYLFNVDKEGIYYGKAGLDYIDLRSDLIDVLEDLERSSIDYYAATRSTYYQRREALVNDQSSQSGGAATEFPDYDDF